MQKPNKKIVVVTGGAGFIGREVVKQLLKKGYRVLVIDKKPESSMQDFPYGGFKYFQYDLTKSKSIERVMFRADYCIHLASESGGIGFLRKNPAIIISNNVKMNGNVFFAAAKERLQRIVFISSSMVFEKAKKFPLTEESLNNMVIPQSAYSLSKLVGENFCQSFYEQYGLKYTICRPSNVYGFSRVLLGRVGESHVIPDLIKKIISQQYPIEVLGDGEQKRCFIHVIDIARGIIAAMESKKGVNEDFNITSMKETSVKELAKIIFNTIRKDKTFKIKPTKGYSIDVRRNLLSNKKARSLLHWQPQKKLGKELPKIVEQFRKEMKDNRLM